MAERVLYGAKNGDIILQGVDVLKKVMDEGDGQDGTDHFSLYCYNTGNTEEYDSQEQYLLTLISDQKNLTREADCLILAPEIIEKEESPKTGDSCLVKDAGSDGRAIICEKLSVKSNEHSVYYLLKRDENYFLKREDEIVLIQDGQPFVVYDCDSDKEEYQVTVYHVNHIRQHDGLVVYQCEDGTVFHSEGLDASYFYKEQKECLGEKQLWKYPHLITPCMETAMRWEKKRKEIIMDKLQKKLSETKEQMKALKERKEVCPFPLLKVYGDSDDLVEIESDGKFYDEIGCFDSEVRICFTDGTVARIGYCKNGAAIWYIHIEKRGIAPMKLTECTDEDADIYSDILEIYADIKYYSILLKKTETDE